MKSSEFKALRKKVFGAMENCLENRNEFKCENCAYDRDTCLLRLHEDQVKLLYAMDKLCGKLQLLLFLKQGESHD